MAESGGSSEPDAPDEIPKWARYNAKDRGCPLFSSVSFTLDESCCSAFGWMLLWHLATALLRPGSWSGPRTSGRTRAARAALKTIAVYQRDVSPRRPPCCRFTPTCSNYAAEAVRRHGALRGGWQTARRLHRCGPRTTPGSHDPVKP